jgi:hypothetical protein
MKGIDYYFGILIGIVIGFFKGFKAGSTINEFIKEYGSFEKIPTRKLRNLNVVGEYMVRLQRMKIAIIIIQTLLVKYNLQEIPNTVEAVCLWLDDELTSREDKRALDQISKSDGVIQSLIQFAGIKDGLSGVQLLYFLKIDDQSHLWEQFKTNRQLIVN